MPQEAAEAKQQLEHALKGAAGLKLHSLLCSTHEALGRLFHFQLFDKQAAEHYNQAMQHARSHALAQGVNPAPPPWKDRPIIDEREGHTTYIPPNELKQHQDVQLQLAVNNALQYEKDVKQRCLQMNQGAGVFGTPRAIK